MQTLHLHPEFGRRPDRRMPIGLLSSLRPEIPATYWKANDSSACGEFTPTARSVPVL